MAEKTVQKTAPKKTVRKTVAKKSVTRAVARKAPTRVTTPAVESGRSKTLLFVMLAIFVVVIGVSIAVGYSDNGQISIEGKISEKRQGATAEEQGKIDSISLQKPESNLPDGGLVGTGKSTPPPPSPPSTSTASTTDDSATSTEELEEGDDTRSDEMPAEDVETDEAPTE